MRRRGFILALASFGALALAGPLGGCAITGALSGTGSDCAKAQHDLSVAKASLSLAQIALTSAEAFGQPESVKLAQTAVDTISSDVTAIQTLVGSACSSPVVATGPGPALTSRFATSVRAPTITLRQAAALAAADKLRADAL